MKRIGADEEAPLKDDDLFSGTSMPYQRDTGGAGGFGSLSHPVRRRDGLTTDSALGTTGHGGTLIVLSMSSSGCWKTIS